MEILLFIAAGAAVGLIVGMTGVGGGALMTPILLLFGFPPQIAIGTDLWYAAITKSSSLYSHHKMNNIRWQIALTMAAGSLPAAVLTGLVLTYWFDDNGSYTHILTTALGFMLILTASAILFKNKLMKTSRDDTEGNQTSRQAVKLWAIGAILGVLVTLSSVGAGAIGTAVLLILYPKFLPSQIVGTDIAHAIPLTFVAGLVHLQLGNVDFFLLGALLMGSIPAIQIGSKLTQKVPSAILQPVLAWLLLGLGLKYAIF
ncbi:sulfite exporter TauE/SafE family protein [Reinekea marina]|uniref:Probable membrane transporter protein n=2 Tax=Reinekea marina TaxID=1310421 RepID=A0ABV7WT87_9GAMM|nr:sulfite exporter TauE/SafE family protein [Reinekea marina]MDN3649698.1 sulfite exporter TauE/SafE family protein [Reinekea marina]